MQIEVYERNGTEFVRIRNKRNLFDAPIEARSNNKKYFAAAGYWYIDDLNNDEAEDNGDEVDGSEALYLFEDDQIIRTIKGVDSFPSDYVIKNDGFFAYLDEDNALIIYTADGKRSTKKINYTVDECGLNEYGAWFIYDDDNSNQKVRVVYFDSMKSWTTQMNDDNFAFYALIPQAGGVAILTEEYDNDDYHLLVYNCKLTDLMPSEIDILEEKLNQRKQQNLSDDCNSIDNYATHEQQIRVQHQKIIDEKPNQETKKRKGFFSRFFGK